MSIIKKRTTQHFFTIKRFGSQNKFKNLLTLLAIFISLYVLASIPFLYKDDILSSFSSFKIEYINFVDKVISSAFRPILGLATFVLFSKVILKTKFINYFKKTGFNFIKKFTQVILIIYSLYFATIALPILLISKGEFSRALFSYNLVFSVLYFSYIFILIPIQGIVEELIFRSFSMKFSSLFINKIWFVISSNFLLFGIYHMFSIGIIYWLIVSCFLSWIYLLTEDIVYPSAIHAAFNLFGVTIGTEGGGDFPCVCCI